MILMMNRARNNIQLKKTYGYVKDYISNIRLFACLKNNIVL